MNKRLLVWFVIWLLFLIANSLWVVWLDWQILH